MNKEKLSEIKHKIKKHAPVIIATAAVIITTALVIRNRMLSTELERMTLGYEDNENIKAAWMEMKSTGEDQFFYDQAGKALFKMTSFRD